MNSGQARLLTLLLFMGHGAASLILMPRGTVTERDTQIVFILACYALREFEGAAVRARGQK